jgi:hypothetical protein
MDKEEFVTRAFVVYHKLLRLKSKERGNIHSWITFTLSNPYTTFEIPEVFEEAVKTLIHFEIKAENVINPPRFVP